MCEIANDGKETNYTIKRTKRNQRRPRVNLDHVGT